MAESAKAVERRPAITRREFIGLAGATAGGFILAEVIDLAQEASRRGGVEAGLKTAYALSKGVVLADSSLCTGCKVCEAVCSLYMEKVGSTDLSRIAVYRMSTSVEYEPLPCKHCVDPVCLRACPVGAIKVDVTTGARVVDTTACKGYKKCIAACPYGIKRVIFDERKFVAQICNLCGGAPKCVEHCPTGALTYFKSDVGVRSGWPIEKAPGPSDAVVEERPA